jgi:adenine/guanine phosphoribosyltransferase-like PRPP-binding protein
VNNDNIRTQYLRQIFDTREFPPTVEATILMAREIMKRHPYDAIAFTGTSGSAMAYILSLQLDVPLVCVRKQVHSHYSDTLEGHIDTKRYLIVDDGIASGATCEKIISSIHKGASIDARCVAILLYQQSYRSSDTFAPDVMFEHPRIPVFLATADGPQLTFRSWADKKGLYPGNWE